MPRGLPPAVRGLIEINRQRPFFCRPYPYVLWVWLGPFSCNPPLLRDQFYLVFCQGTWSEDNEKERPFGSVYCPSKPAPSRQVVSERPYSSTTFIRSFPRAYYGITAYAPSLSTRLMQHTSIAYLPASWSPGEPQSLSTRISLRVFILRDSLAIGNLWTMSCSPGNLVFVLRFLVMPWGRPPCQPPVTHIRCLRRRDSHPTFSLPYPFVTLFVPSAHYYESASVSPFIPSYYLLASLCSHRPRDRKRSNRSWWIQALVRPPSAYVDLADIFTNNCSTVLAGGTFPGPLITGSKVRLISKKGCRISWQPDAI